MSQELLDIADRYDRELEGITKQALDRIFAAYDLSYRTLIDRLRRVYPSLEAAGAISTLVRQGAIAAELQEALRFISPENYAAYDQLGQQIIEAAIAQGENLAGETLAFVGVQAPFTTIPVGAVRNQAENFRRRLVNYSDTQAANISSVVEQGLIQGFGTRKMEASLKALGVSFKSSAETVARTEVLSAFNGAAKSRYEQSGVPYVQVIATPAEGTCSLCYARNGQVYEVTKAPSVPFHPRCRCSILPVLSLSDIDAEFYEKYRQDGLDELKDKGLKPDGGLTAWEKKAGLTVAPAPVWVPGTKPIEPRESSPETKSAGSSIRADIMSPLDRRSPNAFEQMERRQQQVSRLYDRLAGERFKPAPTDSDRVIKGKMGALNALGDAMNPKVGLAATRNDAGEYTGFLSFKPGRGEVEIENLGTDGTQSGSGRALFQQVLAYAAREGKGMVVAPVPSAIGFYEKMGMRKVSDGALQLSASEVTALAGRAP